MIKVRAVKAFPYNGRRIAIGEVFDASEKNAKILKALRKVEYHVVVVAPAAAARPRRKAPAAALPQQPVGDFSAFRKPIPPGPNPPMETPAPVLVPMEQDTTAQDTTAQDAADGEYRRRDLRAEG